jgi:AcrR family transcriptional regulator
MSAKKLAYHHGNLRETLIESAVQILVEGTVQDLSLRALARKAGVSQTAPYRHFEDKESLLAVLIIDGCKKLHAKMESAVAETDYPPAQLKGVGMAYYAFSVEFPAHFHLIFEQRDNCDKSKYPDLLECEQYGHCIVELVVNRCLAMEGSKKIDSELACMFAWSIVHGVSALMLNHSMDEEAPTPESKLYIVDNLTNFFAAALFDNPNILLDDPKNSDKI